MHRADAPAPPAAVSLAALDARRRSEAPDPAIWTGNLAALREVDPTLAGRVEAAELPESWSPVEALDGTPVWRIEPPGHPPAWLGGSAAPRVRADAILARVRCDDRNPALPSAGCGWEILWLIERLPPAGAVYVFEPDVQALSAVLRVVPLAEAIRTGRCRFVAGQDAAALIDLLDREPGLLAPGRIVALPSVPHDRLTQLEQLCSQVMEQIGEHRQRRIEQIRTRFAASPPAHPPRRLLIAALTSDPIAHELACELAASDSPGMSLAATVCDAPSRGHMLAHLLAAEACMPDAVLAVGHEPRPLSEPIARPGLLWHITPLDAAEAHEPQAELHLAASPAIAEALRQAGIAADRVAPLYWAVSDAWLDRTRPLVERPLDPRRVWLLGDLPADNPRRYGITHTTHRRLWSELHRVAARVWSEPTILEPEAILRLASDRCDVHVQDAHVRNSFLRLIRFVIVPRAIRLALARLARQAGCRVTTIGAGWEDDAGVQHQPAAGQAIEALLADPATPRPVVLSGSLPDPLTRSAVQLAAAGLPLVAYEPRAGWLADRFGGVIDPRSDAASFDSAQRLLRALDTLRRAPDPTARRAARLRARLEAGHTWRQRLERLAASG